MKEQALRIALELQAKEYARRLELLNHENARVLEASSKSVHRDVYNADYRGLNSRLDNLTKDIETIRREISVDLAKRTGRVEMLSVIAMVFSLLSPLVIRFFFS